jgi:hypothetical protein
LRGSPMRDALESERRYHESNEGLHVVWSRA